MAKRKTERAGVPRRYSFKLYPTRDQHDEIMRQCQMAGELWNALLQRQEDTYRRWQMGLSAKKYLTFYDMTAEITTLRHGCPEWAELSVWTEHQVADALTNAFQAFFRRAKAGAGRSAGYPRFRKRRDQVWLPHRARSGFKMTPIDRPECRRQLDWWVYMKGIGHVRVMGRFPAEPLAYSNVDIRWHDGAWWMSVCVDMPVRRGRGSQPRTVRLNTIDCFATVDGSEVPAWAVGLSDDGTADKVAEVQREMAEEPKGSEEWHDLRRRLARLQAHAARKRREALHVWTTEIVRSASHLVVVKPAPDLQVATASGKGDERNHGAAVAPKAEFNRHILGQAPGMAVQMLVYKAAEAGIPCEIKAADTLAVGNALVQATKQTRRLRSATRKMEMAA